MKHVKSLALCLLALALVLALAGCGGGGSTESQAPAPSQAAESAAAESKAPATDAKASGTFKLGGVGPLTGDAAIYGTAAMNGAKIAVDEINALGGDVQFEFQAEDDVADGETTPTQEAMDAAKAEAEALSKKLEGLTVKVAAKAGEGGRLFGAVTAKEISECLAQQHGLNIAKTKLVLDEPIKACGGYKIKAKLGYEIVGTVNVMVVEA